jgi:hypothetical protein
VLVLAQLVGQRNGDGWFRTPDVGEMFTELRIPAPGNISARLADLRKRGLLINRKAKSGVHPAGWVLTPLGHKEVLEVIGEIDAAALQPELVSLPGAEFGNARHTVLPPGLAPLAWQEAIKSLLSRSPFENNVLCMTRFKRPAHPSDPIEDVINVVRDALTGHGLRLHLASDRIVDDDLWANVAAYMWGCKFGIGLVEDRAGEGVNDNLKIEIGSMLMAGRRCALLKDTTVPKMPTDLVGRIFKPVDFGDLDAVAKEIHLWAAEDLDLGRCPTCPK